jgi:prepilin-type N-terminal cleavage/methylation domain-containing protein
MARGFTLVEVMIALLLASAVAFTAHGVFGALTEAARRSTEHRYRLDLEFNGRRMLAELLGSATNADGVGFVGQPEHLTFSAWHRSADGTWQVSRVSLGMGSGSLVASGLPFGPALMLRDVQGLELDYLVDFGADAPWVREWDYPVSLPLAVRARVWRRSAGVERVDTLLIPVGQRG